MSCEPRVKPELIEQDRHCRLCFSASFSEAQGSGKSVSMESNNDACHAPVGGGGMRIHEQDIGFPGMSVAYLVGDRRVRIMGQGVGIVRMIEDGGMVVACGKLSDEKSSRWLGN